MAGADDLVRAGIEVGRVEHEWLALPAAQPAMVADQLLEGRHLARHGIDAC